MAAVVKNPVNDEVMQLRPSELFQYLLFCTDVEPSPLVPFIMGGIGIGKSSIVKQAVKWKRNNGYPHFGYLEYRTATQEPTDVTGVPMPNPETQSTVFFKPERLKSLPADWEGYVFLDEFTKAPVSVMNAWSQPILDRCIDELELPKGLRFVIAGNRRYDKSSDNDMAMFMYNRLTQVELVPDVGDTVAYFRSIGMREDLCAFLKFGGPEFLWNYNPDRKVNATPRTWEMAGNAVTLAEKRGLLAGDKGGDDMIITATVTGLVGKAPSTAYMSFRKMLHAIPPVSEVIANPLTAKVFEENSHAYAMALCLARKASPDNIVAIMKYMDRNNIEIAAAFMSDATKRTPALKETRSYIEWAAKHKDLELN